MNEGVLPDNRTYAHLRGAARSNALRSSGITRAGLCFLEGSDVSHRHKAHRERRVVERRGEGAHHRWLRKRRQEATLHARFALHRPRRGQPRAHKRPCVHVESAAAPHGHSSGHSVLERLACAEQPDDSQASTRAAVPRTFDEAPPYCSLSTCDEAVTFTPSHGA